MKILIDSREQVPFSFSRFDVETEVVGLPVADYSLPGFTDRVAVERKTVNDLVSCLKNANRIRFEKELARARYYELFAVIVEASWQELTQGRYRSDMRPHSACQSVLAFQVRYRIPFVWAGSRAGGEYITFSLLQKYIREIHERYKQAVKAA